MTTYEGRALEGASAVDLVVALYDGIIRFLQLASDAVKRNDVSARRVAVKRALDIIIHLQSRLRMDIGGKPAQALSDFYALIFAQILQASHAASLERFQAAIASIRNLRDAWRVVAQENQNELNPPQTIRSSAFQGDDRESAAIQAAGRSGTAEWTA